MRYDDIVLYYMDRKVVCDVKSTFTGYELRVSKWQIDEGRDRGVDVYILVQVDKDFTGGEIIGMVSKKRFSDISELKSYSTECYCLSKDDLTSVEKLNG